MAASHGSLLGSYSATMSPYVAIQTSLRLRDDYKWPTCEMERIRTVLGCIEKFLDLKGHFDELDTLCMDGLNMHDKRPLLFRGGIPAYTLILMSALKRKRMVTSENKVFYSIYKGDFMYKTQWTWRILVGLAGRKEYFHIVRQDGTDYMTIFYGLHDECITESCMESITKSVMVSYKSFTDDSESVYTGHETVSEMVDRLIRTEFHTDGYRSSTYESSILMHLANRSSSEECKDTLKVLASETMDKIIVATLEPKVVRLVVEERLMSSLGL